MVIYLLTALFLGGFGNYLIPLMLGARDMVFPFLNMLSYWVYLLAVLVLVASFFVPGGPTGAGWTLYPPQAIPGHPGRGMGHRADARVAGDLHRRGDDGRPELRDHHAAGAHARHDADAHAAHGGIFIATIMALLAFPALFVSAVMMLFDRTLGTSFFVPAVVSMGQTLKHAGGSRCCFSTCSGSSGIRRSTSSRCRPSASHRISSVRTRARASSATG